MDPKSKWSFSPELDFFRTITSLFVPQCEQWWRTYKVFSRDIDKVQNFITPLLHSPYSHLNLHLWKKALLHWPLKIFLVFFNILLQPHLPEKLRVYIPCLSSPKIQKVPFFFAEIADLKSSNSSSIITERKQTAIPNFAYSNEFLVLHYFRKTLCNVTS